MKKKLLTLLIFGALSASLIACGKEVQLNDNNVRAAKSIIKTVDAYLEGDIDADTAHEKIENEYYNIDEADENYIYFSSNALTIKIEVSRMSFDGGGDVSRIKENRNDIAELIGE